MIENYPDFLFPVFLTLILIEVMFWGVRGTFRGGGGDGMPQVANFALRGFIVDFRPIFICQTIAT